MGALAERNEEETFYQNSLRNEDIKRIIPKIRYLPANFAYDSIIMLRSTGYSLDDKLTIMQVADWLYGKQITHEFAITQLAPILGSAQRAEEMLQDVN